MLGWHAFEALRNQLAHAPGEHPLRQRHSRHVVQLAGLFGQRTHDLDEEERVALGFAVEVVGQPLPIGCRPQHGLHQRRHRCRRQPVEVHPFGAWHLVWERRRFVAPVGADDEQRRARRHRDQPPQRGRALPRPVQVLEHDQRRRPDLEQLLDDRQQTFLPGVGPHRRRVGHRTFEQHRDVGHDGLDDAGLEIGRLARHDQLPERIAPDLIRGSALAHRLALGHVHAAHQCGRAQLVEEPRLAHAALAADQHHAAATCAQVLEGGQQPLPLLVAADEGSRLQEALTRVGGFGRQRRPHDRAELSDHRGCARVAVARVPRQQPAYHVDERGRGPVVSRARYPCSCCRAVEFERARHIL